MRKHNTQNLMENMTFEFIWENGKFVMLIFIKIYADNLTLVILVRHTSNHSII
jgi:hypothetical protein